MGDDDANEGHGVTECVEHVWELRQMLLIAGEGDSYEYGCIRCSAMLIRPPGQLTP